MPKGVIVINLQNNEVGEALSGFLQTRETDFPLTWFSLEEELDSREDPQTELQIKQRLQILLSNCKPRHSLVLCVLHLSLDQCFKKKSELEEDENPSGGATRYVWNLLKTIVPWLAHTGGGSLLLMLSDCPPDLPEENSALKNALIGLVRTIALETAGLKVFLNVFFIPRGFNRQNTAHIKELERPILFFLSGDHTSVNGSEHTAHLTNKKENF